MKIYETINCYDDKEELRECIRAISNLNIAGIRFNLSKARGKLKEAFDNIKSVLEETNIQGEVLLDLAYPRCKPRIVGSNFENQIVENEQYYILEETKDYAVDEKCIFMENICFDLKEKGEVLYYADGLGGFEVMDVLDDCVVVKALNSFSINNKKSISLSTQKADLDFSVINSFLNGMRERRIYFILAFVEDAKDIETFRSAVSGAYSIVSKIESTSGVMNIDQIAKSSQGLLIARGDLAMHADYSCLFEYTNDIFAVAKKYDRELFCATDVLLSLEQNFLPNRAEIIDVSYNMMMGCDNFILPNRMMNLERAIDVLMKLSNKMNVKYNYC